MDKGLRSESSHVGSGGIHGWLVKLYDNLALVSTVNGHIKQLFYV